MPSSTRAKIVCTMGPSSSEYEVIREMLLAGMNVARLNFSHGTQAQHKETIGLLRRAARETGRVLGILLDLQGPKVRVGHFAHGPVMLEQGRRFTITGREVEGDATIVSTTHAGLAQDVHRGDRVLLNDGMISLRVVDIQEQDVVCEVLNSGELKDGKGINIPGAALSVSTITEKDLHDVDFGIDHEVDYVAMSFVRRPEEVHELRAHMEHRGVRLPIISKIEKPQALDHMEAIVSASDGIMVARGDLGVEMPPEDVPAIQKRLIAECNRQGRPVITATQMLESMISHPRPTRAEASDVANAILDGTDAAMLSAESATGRYPVEAVQTMKRIIRATEDAARLLAPAEARRRRQNRLLAVHEGIAVSACTLAEQVGAKAIASITLTGNMATLIARERPSKPIYAVSQFERVLQRLAMVWGIEGLLMPDLTSDIDNAAAEVKQKLLEREHLAAGEAMVLTAGLPFAERQATNMVRVDVAQ